MKAITWKPGSSFDLDLLFNGLREQHYNNRDHRLWKNYSRENFKDAVALTIVFDDEGRPEVCSSISSRSCWPEHVYRIYNRTWKCSNKKEFLRTVTPAMGLAGQDQIAWLRKNVDCKLYFISRETNNWQEWMIEHFRNYNLTFQTDNYKYLTCPNECDTSCWQHIIFNGNLDLLNSWKRHE